MHSAVHFVQIAQGVFSFDKKHMFNGHVEHV